MTESRKSQRRQSSRFFRSIAVLSALLAASIEATAQTPPDAPQPTAPIPTPTPTPTSTSTPTPTPTSTSTPIPTEPSPFSHVRFALQAEPQFGVSGGTFFNQLVGARIDYRFTNSISLGPYLAYANIKGKDGRASNALAAVQLEYRPSLGAGSAFAVPLRFAPGYLPQNGPVLRLSAGLSYALSPHVDLVLDAFAPTFWVIRNRTVVSLGAALELCYAP